jgi:hypothetical protein
MTRDKCFLFHDWDKWEQYEQEFKITHFTMPGQLVDCVETWQRRKCKRCNKEQKEKV